MNQASSDVAPPYPTWMIRGTEALAIGVTITSYRDSHSVVMELGPATGGWDHWIVAGAVVLAMDLAIILLESVRAEQKLCGQSTAMTGTWVIVLVLLSAWLNSTFLVKGSEGWHQTALAVALGMAIPLSLFVLGQARASMLIFNSKVSLGNSWTRIEARENDHHSRMTFE